MINKYKILFLFFFIAFQSYSQSHEVGIWQFRSVGDSDINNFLSNEKNVYSKVAKKAVSEGKMTHWALFQRVGGLSTEPNFVFYNGFKNLTDLDSDSPWYSDSGRLYGLKIVKSDEVRYVVHTRPGPSINVDSENPSRYFRINYANASDANQFVALQESIWKPWLENYIDQGKTSQKYWSASTVISPTGNGYNWNAYTMDGYENLTEALVPYPNGLSDLPEGLNAINELVPEGKFYKTVIWELVMIITADMEYYK